MSISLGSESHDLGASAKRIAFFLQGMRIRSVNLGADKDLILSFCTETNEKLTHVRIPVAKEQFMYKLGMLETALNSFNEKEGIQPGNNPKEHQAVRTALNECKIGLITCLFKEENSRALSSCILQFLSTAPSIDYLLCEVKAM